MPSQHTTSPSSFTSIDRTKILSTLKKLVPERHINVTNTNQDYGPWISLVDARTPALIETESREKFEAGVSDLLRALGSGHTAFFIGAAISSRPLTPSTLLCGPYRLLTENNGCSSM